MHPDGTDHARQRNWSLLDAVPNTGPQYEERLTGKREPVSNTVINAEPVDSADGRELLEEYQQELFQRWSGPLLHDQTEAPADNTGLVPPGGLFLLARVNGIPAGCIGIRALTPDVGETKRMFVRSAFRGQGIGRSLLTAVETEAH
ncbi:GNAT family N-acetyltransferase [Streptomyces sp. RLB3-17]|nr:GNAT family N-acetyltransferase [Streptomyces sp. RLB1-9]QDO16759.1 GNAT family N-acetyltransferase [Streptomyces sp. S1A1-8]QDO26882.1 GNAT family N-acetyltransferase [Streptomyces sp. S1A1-3]QDO36922.1 GNAT family N-acetyltransferase [Streptomyces sp. RLB3-17]